MTEIMKELMPVVKEAISAGKAIGIWYIVAITIVPFLKSLMNWIFIMFILKGVLNFSKESLKNASKE